MDKVKVFLGVLKKHHFWLLCVICIGAGMMGWMMATGSLASAFTAEEGKIKGKFGELDAILQTPNFPNGKSKELVDKLAQEQKQKVRLAWQKVYDEQAQFFKWPEYLGDDFLKYVKSQPWKADFPLRYREIYGREIRREFPKLLAIVGADAYDAPKRDGDAAPGAAPLEDKVVWSAESQERIAQKLNFAVAPQAIDIWLTQEDLWIYQTLLTIIRKVNGDRYVPAIKEINQLAIAQDAAKDFADGQRSGIIAAAHNAPKAAAGDAPVPDAAPPGDGEGPGPAPDEGRYLNAEGKPASATEPLTEFKRMPISMKLRMDQREIATLLTECANSPLPVEVRQLRINPAGGGGNAGAPQSSGAGRYGGKDDAASAGPNEHMSHDVPVELCGIIYMYNPPDPAKLGIDPAEAPMADGAPPATDAAGAAAPADGAAAPAATDAPAPDATSAAPVDAGAAPAADAGGAAAPGAAPAEGAAPPDAVPPEGAPPPAGAAPAPGG
jgi:hypothetical protein